MSTTPAILEKQAGTLPDRPRNIRRVDVAFASGSTTIEWDPPLHVGGVALLVYEVWFDNGAGVFTATDPVALPGPTTTQLTVTGLTDGVTSGIKMRAVNEVGHGEYSDIVYLICASKPA